MFSMQGARQPDCDVIFFPYFVVVCTQVGGYKPDGHFIVSGMNMAQRLFEW